LLKDTLLKLTHIPSGFNIHPNLLKVYFHRIKAI
jgi:hypothetical protein